MSDWLYTDDRLKLRSDCLGFLLRKFGWELGANKLPRYSMEHLHNCAHDWVSQGNPSTAGLSDFFLNNYSKG